MDSKNEFIDDSHDNPLPVKRIFSHCSPEDVPKQGSLLDDLLVLNGWVPLTKEEL